MSTEATVRFPNVTVPLSGEDGNILMIVGRVRSALRRAGVPAAEIEAFTAEVMATGSYDEALQTVMCWVDVE